MPAESTSLDWSAILTTLIANLPTTLMALAAVIVAVKTGQKVDKNQVTTEETAKAVDGKMDQMLKLKEEQVVAHAILNEKARAELVTLTEKASKFDAQIPPPTLPDKQ